MQSGRIFGQGESATATSTQVATRAMVVGGVGACPMGVPVFFGFSPMNVLAIYRMAYERALAEVSARPSLYDRLQNPCWN